MQLDPRLGHGQGMRRDSKRIGAACRLQAHSCLTPCRHLSCLHGLQRYRWFAVAARREPASGSDLVCSCLFRHRRRLTRARVAHSKRHHDNPSNTTCACACGRGRGGERMAQLRTPVSIVACVFNQLSRARGQQCGVEFGDGGELCAYRLQHHVVLHFLLPHTRRRHRQTTTSPWRKTSPHAARRPLLWWGIAARSGRLGTHPVFTQRSCALPSHFCWGNHTIA